MEWEKEAPTLAALKKENYFNVPANYFNELTERTQQLLFIDSLQEERASGLSVPPSYFDTLTDKINANISLAEFKTHREGFTVPADYFNQLEKRITAQTSANSKMIKLWRKPFLKYAVAACLVAASTLGVYVNQQREAKQEQKIAFANDELLYDIDESVIEEYINESQQVKNQPVSKVDMEAYILDNFSASELSKNL